MRKGQNLNCIFNTFGSWIIKRYTYSPITYYFVSPSNKPSRKKTTNKFFYVVHSSVTNFKSVIALSSRGTLPPFPPPYTPLGGEYVRI